MVNEQPKGEMMAKIYCSFSDGGDLCFARLDKAENDFFEYVSTVTGEKC